MMQIWMETLMVTKPYLDDKIGDLKEDIVGKMRKEDEKVNFLIELLVRKAVLSKQDMAALRAIEVFPASPSPLST